MVNKGDSHLMLVKSRIADRVRVWWFLRGEVAETGWTSCAESVECIGNRKWTVLVGRGVIQRWWESQEVDVEVNCWRERPRTRRAFLWWMRIVLRSSLHIVECDIAIQVEVTWWRMSAKEEWKQRLKGESDKPWVIWHGYMGEERWKQKGIVIAL